MSVAHAHGFSLHLSNQEAGAGDMERDAGTPALRTLLHRRREHEEALEIWQRLEGRND